MTCARVSGIRPQRGDPHAETRGFLGAEPHTGLSSLPPLRDHARQPRVVLPGRWVLADGAPYSFCKSQHRAKAGHEPHANTCERACPKACSEDGSGTAPFVELAAPWVLESSCGATPMPMPPGRRGDGRGATACLAFDWPFSATGAPGDAPAAALRGTSPLADGTGSRTAGAKQQSISALGVVFYQCAASSDACCCWSDSSRSACCATSSNLICRQAPHSQCGMGHDDDHHRLQIVKQLEEA